MYPWRELKLKKSSAESMLARELVILKLGGSVITMKKKPFYARTRIIRRIAKEISSALKNKLLRLIIVHGGGSFGHPLAKKYGIHLGFRDERQLIGFAKTVQSMRKLSNIIVESLQGENVPAFPIQPSSITLQKNGRISSMWRVVLEDALSKGLIPVLWGDAVLDEDAGFTILSGDQIVSYLSEFLTPSKVLFATDVDGIYPSDPKMEGAKPFSEINSADLAKLAGHLTKCEHADVTGGMLGKIREILLITSKGIEVSVLNANKPGNVLRALLGEKVGTLIKPQKVLFHE